MPPQLAPAQICATRIQQDAFWSFCSAALWVEGVSGRAQ